MKCMIINIKTGNPIAYLHGISTKWNILFIIQLLLLFTNSKWIYI